MARWERWENSEVAQSERWEGSEVATKVGGGVVRRQGRKDGRAVRWQGGRFFVLFMVGGRRVRPRFHLFVSDAIQRNEGTGCVQDILAWPQGMERFSLDLTQFVRNVAGCGSVWNSWSQTNLK